MPEICTEVQRFRKMAKEDDKGRGLFLDLTDETYESFPFAVLELYELRGLRLNSSNLTSIPHSINRLENLELLELKNNDLKEFPVSLCELTHLKVLDLSDNEIVSIPDDIRRLKDLKILKLQNTKLKGDLSDQISTLTSLVHLDISKNAVEILPESLSNLKQLERLNVWRNSFEEAPSVVAKLTKLKTFDISYNKLTEFNLDLSALKQLEDLDLEGNRLTSFPEKICAVISLNRLDVGRNRITDIPDNIKNLKNLRELWINHNKITSFPKDICKLRSLETLSISYNNIKTIPCDVAHIHKLRNLALDSCGLDKMPLSICMLKDLKWLSLGENDITKLPIVITTLHNLSYINLVGNKGLKIPPPTILKRGIKAIFNYLNEADNKKTVYQKVIFLGNVRAGKSSLSKTMIQGSSQLREDNERTIVLDQMTWTPEENLSLQVYDFGGSDWYDVVQHFFIDKHSIVVLVVSLTDYSKKSYIDCVEKWLQIIQARAPAVHVFVVATHTDLLPDEEVVAKQANILEMMQAREKLQVENVEDEMKRLEGLGNDAKFARDSLKKSLSNRLVLPEKVYSVSSKNLQNLGELKKDLLEKAKELGRVIPSSWHQLYHDLHTSELSKAKSFLSFKDVVQINREADFRCQVRPAYSPGIHRKKPLTAQLSVHERSASVHKKPVTRIRKTSEYSYQSPIACRKNPIENDEHKPRLPRFHVQKLEVFNEQVDKLDNSIWMSQSDRLNDILAFFHSIGDVLWYEGNPEIKNFIFHKQSFLIDLLKRIFSERPDELSVDDAASMKQGLTSKTLAAAREDLRCKGIMSVKLLKGLLDHLHLESKMIEAVMQLLIHFDLCFKLKDEVQTNWITKLHFPWFLSESVPEESASMLSRPPETGNWRFILEYDFPLGCPRTLYETMAVHTHRVVSDAGSIKHWKNGVYARIRESKIMLHRTFDEVNVETVVTVRFLVEGKVINDLWSILTNLHKEFRILMINWPGIMLEMWLVCPHCTTAGLTDPHRFQGENIERCCPENEHSFTCPKADQQGSIPANLIFPIQVSREVPSDDELSKIAYKIGGDWQLLGRTLGLDECDLDHVNANNQQLYEKAYQMLQKWKRAYGSKAHCACLIKALKSEELQRHDIVDKIVNRLIL